MLLRDAAGAALALREERGELVQRLRAEMLCCRERKDLLVETLSIGAMNVNSAMEVFRQQRNMAVVTGADRTAIQLAALAASGYGWDPRDLLARHWLGLGSRTNRHEG